jgi:hypothetical protein
VRFIRDEAMYRMLTNCRNISVSHLILHFCLFHIYKQNCWWLFYFLNILVLKYTIRVRLICRIYLQSLLTISFIISVKPFSRLPQTFHRSSPKGSRNTDALQACSLEVSEVAGPRQKCYFNRKQTHAASHTDLSSL